MRWVKQNIYLMLITELKSGLKLINFNNIFDLSAITKRGVNIKFLLSDESSHKERMITHLKYLIRRFGEKVQVKLFKV
jgi:hypothetical protein